MLIQKMYSVFKLKQLILNFILPFLKRKIILKLSNSVPYVPFQYRHEENLIIIVVTDFHSE